MAIELWEYRKQATKQLRAVARALDKIEDANSKTESAFFAAMDKWDEAVETMEHLESQYRERLRLRR